MKDVWTIKKSELWWSYYCLVEELYLYFCIFPLFRSHWLYERVFLTWSHQQFTEDSINEFEFPKFWELTVENRNLYTFLGSHEVN